MTFMRSASLKVNETKLRESRELAGLTQEQLAKKIRVNRSTVTHWESGRWQPRPDRFKALCKVLRVTHGSLLVDTDDQEA